MEQAGIGAARLAKRYPVFVTLGPLLVWLTVVLHLFLPDVLRTPDGATVFFLFMMLVAVAAVGFIPALALAAADHVMAARFGLSRMLRAAICAALAYPLTTFGFWVVFAQLGLLKVFADEIAVAGLYGIVPAAVCSWVAGRG